MRIFNLVILLFLLSAFTIGIALENNEADKILIDAALNNASLVFENITLIYPNATINTTIPNAEGFFKVIENYIKFIGSLAIESMRAGIYFGYDNPNYFSPEFIILTMKIIVFGLIVSLLIKPAGYVIVFIIMLFIMIIEKIKKRKRRKKSE